MTEEEIREANPKRARKTTTRKSKKETEAESKETAEVPEPEKKPRARRASRKSAGKKEEAKPAGSEEPRATAPELAVEAPAPAPVEEGHLAAAPLVTLKYGKGRSAYAHMGSFRKNAYRDALGKTEWERLIRWRKEETITPVEHPTRLDRARALGYKSKQGVILVRIKVRRGGLRKRKISKGRRARRKGILKITMNKNIQRIAEERVQRHYPNMEVLNSYNVGQDGMHKWFEVILVDPYNPSVLSDKNLNWLSDPAHSSRAHRGLTSAGKRGRGLRWKGKGAEKVRPSIRAHDRKGK